MRNQNIFGAARQTLKGLIMKHYIFAAGLALSTMAGSVNAATLTGLFNVTAVNVVDTTRSASGATRQNFETALGNATNGSDTFTFEGALDFRAMTSSDSTTIRQFLESSAGGLIAGLDDTFGGLQNSTDSIDLGTAVTTFYSFVLATASNAMDFTIRHDDGIAVYDRDISTTNAIGGFRGPNGVRTSTVSGFDGAAPGDLEFLYVSTNGNPSILNVDVAPVPLPAGGLLILTGLGAMAALRRRKIQS